MSYAVLLPDSQRRALARLPRNRQKQIDIRIHALALNPRPPGCTKLAGHDDLYRLRAGDYRVVYHIDDSRSAVTVVAIAHRRDVYRGL